MKPFTFCLLAQKEAVYPPRDLSGVIAIAVILLIGLAVFWLMMLVDCLKNAPSHGNDKPTWVLVIILLGPLGALLYAVIQRDKWPKP